LFSPGAPLTFKNFCEKKAIEIPRGIPDGISTGRPAGIGERPRADLKTVAFSGTPLDHVKIPLFSAGFLSGRRDPMAAFRSDDSGRSVPAERRPPPILFLAFLLTLMIPVAAGPPEMRPPRVAGPFPVAEPPKPAVDLSALFPVSEAIQPQVDFWMRVFTEFSRRHVLIHDSWYVNVVFEVVDLSRTEGKGWAAVRDARREYRELLAEMAEIWDEPERMSPRARRIRAMYDDWPESERFPARDAAERVRSQRGMVDSFRAGIESAGRYLPVIQEILADREVPRVLACLPLIESAYNPFALSHAGAAGLWQLMPVVGRQYELTMNHLIDERRDPIIATRAAARHLATNYRTLKSWPLAITAYNHGLRGMVNAARAVGSEDIGDIIAHYEHRRFGFASRNFYPEFVAALRIFQYPAAHLGPVSPRPPLELAQFVLPEFVSFRTLRRYCGLTADYLRAHNPALLPEAFRPGGLLPGGVRLNLRAKHLPLVKAGYAAIPDDRRFRYVAKDETHRVRRGETLSEIAERFGLSARTLARYNGIDDARRIRAGSSLRLPGRYISLAGAPLHPDPPAKPPAEASERERRRHKVRRGETLIGIARRYGTSPKSIARANGIRNLRIIQAGRMLHIPEG
jgi:membrane-bound lytic murein transglycosylase D